MKFFYAPGTVAIATGLLLEEVGLPFEAVRLSFADGEQTKPDYRAINPKGRVPALVTEQGILTETGAIAEFIAAQVPALGLVPDDPWQAAQMRAVTYYLASTFHVNHAHGPRGIRWANEESSLADMRAKLPSTMTESCNYIEDNCALAPFVMGAEMTIADPWLFAICTWLEGDGVDINNHPKLAAHFALMSARPSARRIKKYGLLR